MGILAHLFPKVKREIQDIVMDDLKNVYLPDGYGKDDIKLAVKRHYIQRWHMRLLQDMLRITEQMDDQRGQLQNAKSNMAQSLIRAEFAKLLDCRNALSPFRDFFEGVVADDASANTVFDVVATALLVVQDKHAVPYFDVAPYVKLWNDMNEVLELIDAES